MKQRITVKELNKLFDAQKEELREWWKPQQGDVCTDLNDGTIVLNYVDDESVADLKRYGRMPLLSIGQMIQLISESKPLKSISKSRFDKWAVNIDTATLGYKDELCDSLWETITRIL